MAFGNETCKEKRDFKCPHCGEEMYVNPRSFANHVRWCKMNPKYEETLEKTKTNLSKSLSLIGKKERVVKCEICEKEYVILVTDEAFEKGDYKHTCSDSCSKKLTFKKVNNDKKKEKIRKSLIEYNKQKGVYPDNYDFESGKYTLECQHCHKTFTSKRKDRKFCSVQCAKQHRYENILETKDALKRYRSECRFRFGIRNFPNAFETDLLLENGWYSATNHGGNTKGVSRDHMFSVREGFDRKIDPYYISHPANCQLILNKDNQSKRTKCSITFEELIDRIKKWEEKYGRYENKINYGFVSDIISKNDTYLE